jgi:hypothetical protein
VCCRPRDCSALGSCCHPQATVCVVDQEGWIVALTAVAAVGGVTGVWLLILAWVDRPHHGWGVRVSQRRGGDAVEFHEDGRVTMPQPPESVTDRHVCTVSVNAQGTAVAYGVQVRLVGCSLLDAPRGTEVSRMTADSDPIELTVDVPEGRSPALVEVIWIQFRPRRRMGQRVDLRRIEGPDWHWRWQWRSLRLRGRHLARTKGNWIEHRSPRRPEIPETDLTAIATADREPGRPK